MTPQVWTGRRLWHALRRAGVVVSVNGDRLGFDAPAGAMTAELRVQMKAHKCELMAVVRGDYLMAAMARLASEPDATRREALTEWFHERAGMCEYDGAMDRDEAERAAYILMCRAMESGGV